MNKYDVIRLIARVGQAGAVMVSERWAPGTKAETPLEAARATDENVRVALVREQGRRGHDWHVFVSDVRLDPPELADFGMVRWAPGVRRRVVRVFEVLPAEAKIAMLGDDYENDPVRRELQKHVGQELAEGRNPEEVMNEVYAKGRTVLEVPR